MTSHPDGPLVPIRPDLVDAARRRAGFSIRALALKAGIRQQTLDAMLRYPPRPGKQRRCRLAARDKLADAIGLPGPEGSKYLGGELDMLPAVNYSVDPSHPDDIAGNPITEVGQYRFWHHCRNAIQRDTAEPEVENEQLNGDSLSFPLLDALMHLTEPHWWRLILLKYPDRETQTPREIAKQLADTKWDPTQAVETANLTAHLVQVFQELFEPWFEGKARLNYESLEKLRHLLWISPKSDGPAREPVELGLDPTNKK